MEGANITMTWAIQPIMVTETITLGSHLVCVIGVDSDFENDKQSADGDVQNGCEGRGADLHQDKNTLGFRN